MGLMNSALKPGKPEKGDFACGVRGGKKSPTVILQNQGFKLLYMERISIKVLQYSTGIYIQYPVINQNEIEH